MLPKKVLPETIDRYQVISECGNGAMAVVYQAFDPQRQQEVAVKVLLHEHRTPDFRVQFKREIDINFSFKHEAVVPILGYGQFKGQLYLVLRYMTGGSLDDRIGAGKTLPLVEVVELLKRITPALDAAHLQGIIHRDMKPSNILFDEQGQAYLADFGISCLLEEQAQQASSSPAVSMAYMSPEQVRGDLRLDGRSDLYSLGVMVYEMLAGRLPYYDSDPVRMANNRGAQPVPDILKANPRLPSGCNDFILKALSKNPAGRFSTGAEMADALLAVANQASGSPLGGSKRTEVLFAPPSRVTMVGDSTPAQPPPRPAAQPSRAAPPAREPRPAVRPDVRPVVRPASPQERDGAFRQEARPAVRPAARPVSPQQWEEPDQPVRQPARPAPERQAATPQRSPSLPDLSGLGNGLGGILYRFFGINIMAPTIPLPMFLRPITGMLGISNTISLWPKSIPGPVKILLLLFVLLAVLVGCAAACFLVVRFGLNRGTTFTGWDQVVYGCIRFGGC